MEMMMMSTMAQEFPREQSSQRRSTKQRMNIEAYPLTMTTSWIPNPRMM
jgi:hypothetical protein